MKTRILAFTGPMLAGKTTALEQMMGILQEAKTHYSYVPLTLKFAEPLYEMQKAIYSIASMEEPIKDRKLLQFLGTDWARSIDEDVWVKIWRRKARTHLFKEGLNTKTVVLTDDCRYPNEAAMIKELGGTVIQIDTPRTIRANRGKLINEEHISENGIPKNLIDHYLDNNGEKLDLYWNLRRLVKEGVL